MVTLAIVSIVLLAVFLVLQVITFYLVWHYQYLPAIRHRSIPFTYMLMVGYTVQVTNTLLAVAFPAVYPCMLNPWVGGVLLPTCTMMVICRFYRLVALYRWNSRELDEYIRSRPVSAYLERINSASPSDHQDMTESQVNDNMEQPALPRNSVLRKSSFIDKILEAYTDSCAIKCTLAVAGILVIPALLITFLRPFHDLRPLSACSINLIDMSPILASIFLIVSIGGGMIALRVMQARDVYGIRTELTASITISLVGIIVSAAWVIYSYVTIPVKRSMQERIFYYAVSGLINGVGFIVCNFIIVTYPVLSASWNARNGASNERDISNQITNLRRTQDNRLSFATNLPSYPKQFEQVLNDPLALASFRSYCIPSFSIAACVFYEKFSALQRHYRAAESDHGVSLDLLPEFVDKLEILYHTFIVPEAPLSLASTLHPVTFTMLQNAYQQRQICYDLLNDAAMQIKQHLFIWSYPAYIKAQNNEHE
ncbi:hypothetical protein BDF22DRAFT_694156 [Syncephalis plumigaleata]|nr:hypothetical protein BDF22DRAFT_694156 [Syncephalis plumigaleata]